MGNYGCHRNKDLSERVREVRALMRDECAIK